MGECRGETEEGMSLRVGTQRVTNLARAVAASGQRDILTAAASNENSPAWEMYSSSITFYNLDSATFINQVPVNKLLVSS